MLAKLTTTQDPSISLSRIAITPASIMPVITTTIDPLYDSGIHRQQLVENTAPWLSGFDIGHWSPTDCSALINALVASFSVIIISELGDKTFIITAIMAMKNSRLLVFLSSALALFMMTVLSVGMGVAVTVIPKLYTHYASIVLFVCFGFKMLREAYDITEECDESEFDEVKRSLEENDCKVTSSQNSLSGEKEKNVVKTCKDTELSASCNMSAIDSNPKAESLIENFAKTLYVTPIIIKVFTMVFVAEWGDRSQISTVILAAREDVVGVFVGSFVGHVLCTGLAVIGGRFVAEMISVKTMTLIGGLTFLFFAAFAIISGPE